MSQNDAKNAYRMILDKSVLKVFDEWLEKDSGIADKPIIINSSGKQYTAKDIVEEIRKNTPLGDELRKDFVDFILDLAKDKKVDISAFALEVLTNGR